MAKIDVLLDAIHYATETITGGVLESKQSPELIQKKLIESESFKDIDPMILFLSNCGSTAAAAILTYMDVLKIFAYSLKRQQEASKEFAKMVLEKDYRDSSGKNIVSTEKFAEFTLANLETLTELDKAIGKFDTLEDLIKFADIALRTLKIEIEKSEFWRKHFEKINGPQYKGNMH